MAYWHLIKYNQRRSTFTQLNNIVEDFRGMSLGSNTSEQALSAIQLAEAAHEKTH
jgi:hypothetical protein